jgi:hypothetical protein
MGYLDLEDPVDYEKLKQAGVDQDLINKFNSVYGQIIYLANNYISLETAQEALEILAEEVREAIEDVHKE